MQDVHLLPSIASELVKGCSETEAVANAKAFVYESIKQSNEFGVVQYAKIRKQKRHY